MLYPMRPWRREQHGALRFGNRARGRVSRADVRVQCVCGQRHYAADQGRSAERGSHDADSAERDQHLIADESKLEQKVTLSFKDMPLEKALDYVVKGAGVSYKKMDDGTYIIGGPTEDETAIVPPPSTLPPVEPVYEPEHPKIQVTSIKLMHSRPSELLALMGYRGTNPMPNCEPTYPDRSGVGAPKHSIAPGGTQVLNGQTGEVLPVGGSGITAEQSACCSHDRCARNELGRGQGGRSDGRRGAGSRPSAVSSAKSAEPAESVHELQTIRISCGRRAYRMPCPSTWTTRSS